MCGSGGVPEAMGHAAWRSNAWRPMGTATADAVVAGGLLALLPLPFPLTDSRSLFTRAASSLDSPSRNMQLGRFGHSVLSFQCLHKGTLLRTEQGGGEHAARSSGHAGSTVRNVGKVIEICSKYGKYGETCGPSGRANAAVPPARGPDAEACAVHAASLDGLEEVWGELGSATPPWACEVHADDK